MGAAMAEAKDAAALNPAQKKRERIQLVLFLVGAAFIIVAMFGISQFLSGVTSVLKGESLAQGDKYFLIALGTLGIALFGGILYVKYGLKR